MIEKTRRTADDNRRVVVTGLGTLNPLGNDATTTWEAAKAGRSGIGPITLFDAAGYPTKDANGRTFVHDAENKKIEVKNASNETIGQYWFDGDGRRVKKRGWINGQWETTVFVYDASSRLVAEYSTILNPTPQVAYLTADHLGSPRINTNELGTVISRHDYRPYGEEITERTHAEYIGDTIRKQFTGYDWDLETELSFADRKSVV